MGLAAAAVVPAYNEESTVGDVVKTLVSSRLFREVIVVSDGSSDATAKAAREAGATLVHELPWNHGKGAALSHGVMHTDAPIVCFFDADLKGFTAAHAEAVLAPVAAGQCYMNMGLRDRGPFWTSLALRLPRVGGERALRREIFDAIPSRYLKGFKVESALEYFCKVNGLPSGVAVLPGLSIRRKYEKVGLLRAFGQYCRMWGQVAAARLQVRLAKRQFAEHGSHMSHHHR
ncbi:MAG TPA: glycosyltransferase [Candidatus Binatia bacterium]|jgi:glycosyltransferase involved in cell wall biosynthesis|nr:glycosyltransferase [Candidatus Binatia bacterium]